MGHPELSWWMESRNNSKCKGEIPSLSTAQLTVRLSGASVEMTFVAGGEREPTTAKTEADHYG
jgi:hypothetical protein